MKTGEIGWQSRKVSGVLLWPKTVSPESNLWHSLKPLLLPSQLWHFLEYEHFFAQGIPREQLPFQYRSIGISDEDRLMRKAMRFDRVVDFISKAKHSGNARACFYCVLATIWAFRPIEMGGKFSSITPKPGAIQT